MSFIVRSEKKVAESDIPVFKEGYSVGSNYFVPFVQRDFKYIKGETAPKVELKSKVSGSFELIDKGYHSKAKKPDADITGEFVIPAGSEYYFDEITDELVSDQLKYIKWKNGRS